MLYYIATHKKMEIDCTLPESYTLRFGVFRIIIYLTLNFIRDLYPLPRGPMELRLKQDASICFGAKIGNIPFSGILHWRFDVLHLSALREFKTHYRWQNTHKM